MDAAKRGNAALEKSDFLTAIAQYSTAISEHPEAADYYIQRSSAYRRGPKEHSLALADAESAVYFANRRARRELIAKAQLERGIVLYSLGRYGDAQQCFAWSEEYNADEKRIGIWKIKIGEKLKGLQEDVKVGVDVVKIPEVDVEKVKGEAKAVADARKPAATSAPAPKAPAVLDASKIRHDWYQTTDTVVISLMAKGVPKDKTTVDIQPSSVSITFPLPTGSDYDLTLEPLFDNIDVSASTYKVMSTKVEFVLKKSIASRKWATLEGTEGTPATKDDKPAEEAATAKSEETTTEASGVADATAKLSTAHLYPSSSRTGPKNWDKIMGDEPEEVGSHPDDFFKLLYKDADPDTRRAMMKSYQESNGTALSTNWNEVKAKKYETTPPDGMEAKKWGE